MKRSRWLLDQITSMQLEMYKTNTLTGVLSDGLGDRNIPKLKSKNQFKIKVFKFGFTKQIKTIKSCRLTFLGGIATSKAAK